MANKIQLDDKNKLQIFGEVLYKGIMSGISHIIPVVLIGGILLALVDIVGMEILGWNLRGAQEYIAEVPFRQFLYTIRQISLGVLGLMIPVLSAYVAHGIGGKSALAPGFTGGLLAKGGAFGFINIAASGFLGALFSGAIAGFMVLALKNLPIKKKYESLNNLFITPLISGIVVILPMIFFVGPAVAGLNTGVTSGLQWMVDHNMTILVGILIGLMANFDFGGPVNKIAYLFCVGLWADGHMVFYSAFTIAKIIPGISVALAAMTCPRLFTQEERDEAIPSLILSGLGGIGEQVIPFALRDPLRVIPAQMIGGAISAALVMFSQITIGVGAGGSLITALVTSNPVLWLVYFAIGTAVSYGIMVVLKKRNDTGNAGISCPGEIGKMS